MLDIFQIALICYASSSTKPLPPLPSCLVQTSFLFSLWKIIFLSKVKIVGRLFGCLSVVFRLYEGSQVFDGRLSSVVCRLLLVCWASVSYQWLVDLLSIVLRLSVRCQSLVCRASYGCPLIAGQSIVAGRLSTVADHFSIRVRVGNLSAVNWPTVSLVELYFNFINKQLFIAFPSFTW